MVARRWRRIGLGCLVLIVVARAGILRGQILRAKAVRGAHYTWETGRDYVYRFHYNMAGEANAGTFYVPSNANVVMTPLSERADGLLRYTPVGVPGAEGVTTLLVTWHNEQGGEEVAPFAVNMSGTGAIESVTFNGASTPPQRHRVRNLLALFQFQLPTEAAATWVARETDLNGVWPTRYRVVGTRRGVIRCEKQTQGGALAGGMAMKRTGLMGARFDTVAGRLLEVHGRQKKQVTMGDWSVGREDADFSLALTGVELHDNARSVSVARSLAAVRAHAMLSSLGGRDEQALDRLASLRRRVAGTSLPAVMARFHDNPNGTVAELLEASRQLEAYLELDPEAAALASVRGLALLGPDTAAFSSIATALTTAGNRAAQEALQQAMAARGDDVHAVRRLIPHLGMVQHPTAPSEAFLRGITERHVGEDVAATAHLSLGIMGSRLRESEPERADKLFVDARRQLNAHHDDDLFLRVLGNMGNPRQPEVVKPLLKGDDAAARALALSSLRFVDTQEARDILLNAAQSDPSSDARMRAVEALGHHVQEATALDLYLSQLKTETSVPVLKETLRNLSTMTRSSRVARAAFKEFLETCGHPDLCPYARGLWSSAT